MTHIVLSHVVASISELKKILWVQWQLVEAALWRFLIETNRPSTVFLPRNMKQ